MDLVEIRKKAKSRTSKKKKTGKEEKETVRKKTAAEEQPAAPAEKAASADALETQPQTSSRGEYAPVEKEKAVPVETREAVPAAIKSLDDVLLSQREEVKEEEEELLQLLTFQLGEEEYALNIMDIKEIIRPKTPTEVPKTPEYILGIFSLRGTIIPVFDVSLRLGLPQGERGAQNRIVVVRSREHFYGLHVDSVVQVLDIPLSKIEPPPEILGGVEGEFLRGIGRIDDRLIILLNLEKIIKLDEGDGSGHLELPSG